MYSSGDIILNIELIKHARILCIKLIRNTEGQGVIPWSFYIQKQFKGGIYDGAIKNFVYYTGGK